MSNNKQNDINFDNSFGSAIVTSYYVSSVSDNSDNYSSSDDILENDCNSLDTTDDSSEDSNNNDNQSFYQTSNQKSQENSID